LRLMPRKPPKDQPKGGILLDLIYVNN